LSASQDTNFKAGFVSLISLSSSSSFLFPLSDLSGESSHSIVMSVSESRVPPIWLALLSSSSSDSSTIARLKGPCEEEAAVEALETAMLDLMVDFFEIETSILSYVLH
jgi:hypothetical protein